MSNPRKITVEQDNPIWQEYDREVKVELWHNDHQTTSLRLSRDEASSLLDLLARFLESTPTTAVTGGAVRAGGAGVAHEGADGARGAVTGAQEGGERP